MKRIFAALVGLLFLLTGCSNQSGMEDDLTSTLDAMISQQETQEAYLYDMSFLEENDGETTTLELIRQKVTYEIMELKDSAAIVRFTVPDVVAMLESAAAEESVADTAQLLHALEQALQQEFPTKEYEVEIPMEKVEEHWYLVPNDTLENALSGGLVEAYSSFVQERVEALTEENQ